MNKMKDTPVGKAFAVDGHYFYYDSLTNRMIEVTGEVYGEIGKMNALGVSEYLLQGIGDEMSMLFAKGFFSPPFLPDECRGVDGDVGRMLERCVGSLVLQVTQDCNFRCRYCFFANDTGVVRNHEKKFMSEATAKSAIDFLLAHSADSDAITISFYGGEPLLAFDVIEKSVNYAKDLFVSKSPRFSITTNGSVMNGKIADFLAKNSVSLLISLDGPREIQNRHRKFSSDGSGTFDTVIKNITHLRERHREYFERHVMFNPVMFADEKYSDVISFFDSLGVPRENVRKQYANMKGVDYDYDLFSSGIADMPDYDRYSEFNAEGMQHIEETYRKKSLDSVENFPSGGCVPGLIKLFVTTDGDFYPCEKVNETDALKIGNLTRGFDIENVKRIADLKSLSYERCRYCYAVRFCSMCVLHCTNPETGDIDKETKEEYCDFTLKMSLAALKHQAKHYLSRREGDKT
ncbi:MAG: radical SAM protein [Firmicutes bacterium]|nr:radical SAM protein [Bacillota bacterium]